MSGCALLSNNVCADWIWPFKQYCHVTSKLKFILGGTSSLQYPTQFPYLNSGIFSMFSYWKWLQHTFNLEFSLISTSVHHQGSSSLADSLLYYTLSSWLHSAITFLTNGSFAGYLTWPVFINTQSKQVSRIANPVACLTTNRYTDTSMRVPRLDESTSALHSGTHTEDHCYSDLIRSFINN